MSDLPLVVVCVKAFSKERLLRADFELIEESFRLLNDLRLFLNWKEVKVLLWCFVD